MANIYVDLVNGSDLNNGNSGSQVKNLFRAIWQAKSGDTILCSGTTLANPHRGRINLPAGVTIRPANWSERIYLSAALNVSNGEVYEVPSGRASFHAAVTGADPNWDTTIHGTAPVWSNTGAALDTTTPNLWGGTGAGNGSILLNAGDLLDKTWYLHGRRTRLRIGYKCAAGARLQANMATTAAEIGAFGAGRYSYNFALGLWDSYANFDLKDAGGNNLDSMEWTEAVTAWWEPPTEAADFNAGATTSGASADRFRLTPTGGDVWIQYVIVECESVWTSLGIDVYQLRYKTDSGFGSDSAVAGRVSTVSGLGSDTYVTGVFYVLAGEEGDPTAYRIAEGAVAIDAAPTRGHNPPTTIHESHIDDRSAGTASIKFKCAPGTTIDDYKIYMTAGSHCLYGGGASGGGHVHAPTLITSQHSIYTAGSATWNFHDVEEYVSLVSGCEGKGTSTINLNGFYSEQPANVSVKFYGGGVVAGADASASVATVNVRGGLVIKAGDDAYQPIGAGVLNLYGCGAIDSTGNDIELNGSNNPVMTIHGFSGNGAFRDESTSTSTVTISNAAFAAIDLVRLVRDTSTYTVGDAVHTSAGNIGLTGGATATASAQWAAATLNANLSYTDEANGDLTPTTGSDLYMSGVKWWGTGARPTSANGEPYPDFDLDAGGCQSAHGPFHPGNLLT